MRYTLAFLLSALCTVAIAAQAPAAPPAGQEPTQKPTAPPAASSSTASKVTYTGCLKPGTAADTWMLENAETASKSATTATSGAASKTTLNLTVKPSENIKPHANHKIEVTGTIGPASASGGAAAGAASSAPRQSFTVESFKMVSATCP